ncbi:MAG: 1-acyl-sn-glycerol-3-phosphate acyltransferase [Alphaproteobacteria bacterium]|nr:1-acyl-sn-glycerol-3-phosphate acyltransferase [Alphaproteobacteria bacterium]
MHELSSPVLAALRLCLLGALTLVVVPPALAMRAARRHGALARWVRLWWRGIAWAAGLRINQSGAIADTARPVLFVSNHAGYLDIIVLGALLPACFVSKAEVSGWPVFGWLSRLGRTVFIQRKAARSASQRDELTARLAAGDSLILFPEGTSSDGNRTLPFKSSLFAIAAHDQGRLPVQPISIAYTRLDGMAVGHAWRPLFAWYGAMALVPHFWCYLGLGKVGVELRFHPPTTLAEHASRKALSAACHRVVARGVGEALTGRPGAPPVGEPAAQLDLAGANASFLSKAGAA